MKRTAKREKRYFIPNIPRKNIKKKANMFPIV